MLTIGKLGTGQERYYLDKVAEGAEDYYSGEGEVAGEWLGDAAEDLDLSGEVEAAQLEAMLTGRNPVGGEPLLGMNGVPAKGGVPGFDLTFSAPKSVSLLWGLGGPVAAAEVSAAHREAVHAALDYMQREACWTRRGAGGSEFVKGNGYLAAGYVHRSSRNGDPQLHTHVLIANATKGPDGRWTRLYHPAIYDHAKTAGYIYEAHLRHELTRRLGVEWQPIRKGIAEIAGFADEHLRVFSTRRAEILEAAGADASARSMQVAALATRKPKERDVGHGELLARWRSRANEIGLDREAIARTFDPEAALRIGTAEAPVVLEVQLGRAVTASASHFDRREAIQAVADSLPQGAPGAEVERLADAFLASDSVIQIAKGAKGPRYTTRRIWELEREALATAERMQAQGPDPAGELIAARVIGARPTLKADQREMIRRLLTSPEGVAVVIGEAGTGKTFAIVAAAEGWAQAGIELRAAAPTWRAANVMRAEGLPASSIASLLLQLDRAEHDVTRVNDPRAEIFNRERWRIAEVDAAERRVVLDGIDQAKRVQIGEGYLARTNPHSEAPALEHAYAVTTYSAQGTTVDRAFVMADPSMDKQELYVAASRSREETFIYATPEIQAHREEIAPASPHLREGIPHIAEAAERDRSQLAAHDEALRSRFSGLPTEELVARRDDLRAAASHEESRESQRRSLQERIERARDHIDGFEAEREAAQALPRRDELDRIDSWEARSRRQTAQLEAELADIPVVGDAARRELAVADQVLAQRRELAIIAARISPPTYIKNELGERPSDPTKRKAWDRGVSQIERYRQEHGIKDPNRALGQEAKRRTERARQEATWRRIREAQRALGLGQHAARARQLGRGLSIGR